MKKLFLSLLLFVPGLVFANNASDSKKDQNPHREKGKKEKVKDHKRPRLEKDIDKVGEDVGHFAVNDIADPIERHDSFADPISSRLQLMRTTPEIAKILDEGRPHEPHSIPVPKFVVVNPHNQDFILTVGGQLNLVVGGDFGNNLYKQSNAGISFVTNAIPVPATLGKRVDLYINAINGSADMQVVGFANTPNQVTGYFKIGTNGITTSIVLQRAYVSWRGITAGLKLTLFQDDYACQPPTIDPEGPSGEVSAVAYEIAYKSKSYSGFRFAAALDMPTYNSSLGYYRGTDYPTIDDKLTINTDFDQFIPDVPAWVEYSWSQWNRIRVSGIMRWFRYKDLMTNQLKIKNGWGVMLSGNIQPAKPWIVYYQFAVGQGIGNYIQDIAGHPYSFIPHNNIPGRMNASTMMGLNLGLTYNATDRLQFNVVGSEARIWGVRDYANMQSEDLNYRYAVYVAANCFYNVNSFLQFGVEYLYGYRRTWNIGGAYDNRAQAQVSFSF